MLSPNLVTLGSLTNRNLKVFHVYSLSQAFFADDNHTVKYQIELTHGRYFVKEAATGLPTKTFLNIVYKD